MEIQSYKDLVVWNKSMDLVELVYKLTAEFPKSETFGLSSQLRRAAVSIPSNIAEGKRRGSRKEYCHFLYISYGSAAEVETQLDIAKRLGYGSEEQIRIIRGLLTEVLKMLNALLSSLRFPTT